MVQIARFYLFAPISDVAGLRHAIKTVGLKLGIKGSILVAGEGINGTVAGSWSAVSDFFARLRLMHPLQALAPRFNDCDFTPFLRFKVLEKRETISMDAPAFDVLSTGAYVPPQQWNELLAQPDVVLLDTRNEYEYRVGSFKGAINPRITHFRDFPQAASALLPADKSRPVALFCTGGIRCEKATAWTRKQGFERVYQLHGGILSYLEQIPIEQSLWQGECFVFDQRVSVKHRNERGSYDLCYACRRPVAPSDRLSPLYEFGVSCPYCHHQHSDAERRRFRERIHQIELAKQRHTRHIGPSAYEKSPAGNV